jgi:hypothetical protein
MLTRGSLQCLHAKPLATCLLVPLAISHLACGSVAAATLPVTNCNDSGSGSLRAALAIANSGDTVDMTALTCSKISLGDGALQIPSDNLTLKGPGANALTIANDSSSYVSKDFSVFHHSGVGTLRIDSLRMTDSGTHSHLTGASECIASSGTVYLNRSIVTECSGGAVFANGFSARDSTISNSYRGIYTRFGNVSIIGSTISGNASYERCTALRLGLRNGTPAATAVIANSTISDNHTDFQYIPPDPNSSGCIYESVTISNSTFAFNSVLKGDPSLYILAPTVSIESSIIFDLSIPVSVHVSGHNNLIRHSVNPAPADTITSDPLLLPLADNGGPTRTRALAPGSPAIDAGNNFAALASDQRGSPFQRNAGTRPDIGAFELQAPPVTSVAIGPGFTGSWFDPNQSGHGLMIEVLSDSRVLAMWFAFNPDGTQQSWFGGVGTYSGATATITDVVLPTGGRWIPNFDPQAIARNPWGTLTLTFTDCNHGRVDFNSVRGYGNGSMNLLRLTQPLGLTCP